MLVEDPNDPSPGRGINALFDDLRRRAMSQQEEGYDEDFDGPEQSGGHMNLRAFSGRGKEK